MGISSILVSVTDIGDGVLKRAGLDYYQHCPAAVVVPLRRYSSLQARH